MCCHVGANACTNHRSRKYRLYMFSCPTPLPHPPTHHHPPQVYLPMCVVYGKRATGPPSPLTESLREELYSTPYDSLNWNAARFHCCKADLFYPHPLIQDVLWNVLYYAGEPLLQGSWLRKKAIEECMALIHYEVGKERGGEGSRNCASHGTHVGCE